MNGGVCRDLMNAYDCECQDGSSGILLFSSFLWGLLHEKIYVETSRHGGGVQELHVIPNYADGIYVVEVKTKRDLLKGNKNCAVFIDDIIVVFLYCLSPKRT